MKNTAIYRVIENGKEKCYRTYIAGGYSYPVLIYKAAEKAAAALNSTDPIGKYDIGDMLLFMKADERFPKEDMGQKLFTWDPFNSYNSYYHDLGKSDEISYLITLDYDHGEIDYIFNYAALGFDLDSTTIKPNDDKFTELLNDDYDDYLDREIAFYLELKGKKEPGKAATSPVMTVKCRLGRLVEYFKLPLSERRIAGIELKHHIHLDEFKVEGISTYMNYLQLASFCTDATLSGLNRIANWVCKLRMMNKDPHPLKLFAAIMSTKETWTMSEIIDIAEHFNTYELFRSEFPDVYARYILEENPNKEPPEKLAAEVARFEDIWAYGEWKAEQNGAVQTNYGYILRKPKADSAKGKNNG